MGLDKLLIGLARVAPKVRAVAIRWPLLRADSKWPRRFGAVRTRHCCFWAILHGSFTPS